MDKGIKDKTEKQLPDFHKESFNPHEEIGLDHLEIVDTSKGHVVDLSLIPYGHIHTYKCLDCLFKYEGHTILEHCMRCNSTNIQDV